MCPYCLDVVGARGFSGGYAAFYFTFTVREVSIVAAILKPVDGTAIYIEEPFNGVSCSRTGAGLCWFWFIHLEQDDDNRQRNRADNDYVSHQSPLDEEDEEQEEEDESDPLLYPPQELELL
jgi:hypothetical protein